MRFRRTPIGEMTRRIKLQRPQQKSGDTGEMEKVYTTYTAAWAKIRTLSGGERMAAQQVAATLTHEITMAYRSGLTIRADDRIVYGSRIFDIKDIRNVDEANIEIRMRCTEVLA